MSNYTFLTDEQLFKEGKMLEVIKKRGTAAEITDFSILLGGYANYNQYTNTNVFPKGRTGNYWTGTKETGGYVCVVNYKGKSTYDNVDKHYVGARPALQLLKEDKIVMGGIKGSFAKDNVLEMMYGMYPQSAVSKEMEEKLEIEYRNNRLKKTANGYTTALREVNKYNGKFKSERHDEYEYEGKKYVRIRVHTDNKDNTILLSNGEKYKDGDNVWIAVEPIKWLGITKDRIIVTEKIIFAGVQFEYKNNHETNEQGIKDIKQFINEYWLKEIDNRKNEKYNESDIEIELPKENESTPQNSEKKSIEIELPKKNESTPQNTEKKSIEIMNPKEKDIEIGRVRKTRLQRLNPYKSQDEQERKMTVTEELRSYIEDGESVLVRGPSGIGKTEMIKSLYPNLIYLKLINNMISEHFIETANLTKGLVFPADNEKQTIMSEITDEEKKLARVNIQNINKVAEKALEMSRRNREKTVILLDDLLSVKPVMQNLAYNLILNRFAEGLKENKLPNNVVIVATGNQKKYSPEVNDLDISLEKKINHIIDIEPRVGEWIYEYAIPNGIHPQVIGYMLSKYEKTGKSEAIEDIGYFFENPDGKEKKLDKYEHKERTNDPRSWTQISDTLKNFERDLQNGNFENIDLNDALKRRIGSKLREECAEEFCRFYNEPAISPEEIVEAYEKDENGEIKYKINEDELPQNIDEKYACMATFATADAKQVIICRDFIKKYFDSETLSIFDVFWAGRDEKKIRQIKELRMKDQIKDSRYCADDTRRYVRNGMRGFDTINLAYIEHQQNRGKEERLNDDWNRI